MELPMIRAKTLTPGELHPVKRVKGGSECTPLRRSTRVLPVSMLSGSTPC